MAGRDRVELGRCLIAPTLSKNPTFDETAGSVYSIDMVRLKVKVPPSRYDQIAKILDTWAVPDMRPFFYASNRIGGYRGLWVFEFEESSVSCGMGLVQGTGKTEAGIGFVEFNPNKVGRHGMALVRRLLGAGARLEVVRYDLAIDYAVKRDSVRIVKDGRKYGCEISNGMTEYLGQRNKPGRVKVYDKTAESGLDADVTRVELTCDAAWSVDQVLGKLPTAFCYDSVEFDGLKGVTRAFALSVQAHMGNGDSAETWLRLCDPKTRQKLRRAFAAAQAFGYDARCIAEVLDKVAMIADGTWEDQGASASTDAPIDADGEGSEVPMYGLCPICGGVHDDGAVVGGVFVCFDCADRAAASGGVLDKDNIDARPGKAGIGVSPSNPGQGAEPQ